MHLFFSKIKPLQNRIWQAQVRNLFSRDFYLADMLKNQAKFQQCPVIWSTVETGYGAKGFFYNLSEFAMTVLILNKLTTMCNA